MIFLEISAKYAIKKTEICRKVSGKDEETTLPLSSDWLDKKWKSDIFELNERLGMKCALDGNISIAITGGRPNGSFTGIIEFISVASIKKDTVDTYHEEIIRKITSELGNIYELEIVSSKEICADKANDIIRKGMKMVCSERISGMKMIWKWITLIIVITR